MRSIDEWLAEYGESHQNPVNKALHWLCVPPILLSALGFLWAAPFPATGLAPASVLNWATLAMAAGLLYYTMLSRRLALGMLPVLAVVVLILRIMSAWPLPLWQSCLAIFAVAWVGQFIGHAVEGRRPSFFKDLQFLLIGPLWLLGDLYRRLGLRY